ncbi:hypothetical protein SDC9_154134 [bioreactor metagenome]|uniref:Uncharacterized protein n=1 Tax=bioreactor metagenome TaxID=1076179 RepID=A0A645EY82_9ZZZZ
MQSRIRLIQASISLVPLLQCTIATGSPAGVVTRSISRYTRESSRSRTIMPNTLVPTLTLPVRGKTLFVATMPVPASPSGGQSGMPASSAPLGSSSSAPSRVREPARSPATATRGRICSNVQGYMRSAISRRNAASMRG